MCAGVEATTTDAPRFITDSPLVVTFPGCDLDLTAARLPSQRTPFVGRERELAALQALMRPEVRLLTLTGPGGIGKTRLAVRLAEQRAANFPDGVAFVPLAAVRDPELVSPTIFQVLGGRKAGGDFSLGRLHQLLGARSLLLVLDNFEHLLPAAGDIAELLDTCPRLKVLVTSRVALRLSAEQEYRAPPLSLPTSDLSNAPEALLHADAVLLFLQRASAAAADFAAPPAALPTISAICHRLDGLPLAIELAAARVKHLSPDAMLDRLALPETRLPLLTGGPRDAPARLQTMRDAIAWSYDWLTDEEQAFFRRLAVFVGGFTLDAAAWVTNWEAEGRNPSEHRAGDDTLELVAALIDKSLVQAEVLAVGVMRYGQLETIREFGLEQLSASGEIEAARQRHASWYLAFAEDAGPRAKQPDAAPWVEMLAREHPNLRTALTWFLDHGDGLALVRMAGALWPFWHEQTYFAEGHRWLRVALDLGQAAPAADRIRALTGAGTLAWYQTRIEQAGAWHEQALALAREVGDQAAEAFSLINLSAPAMEFGDYDLAFERLEAGLAAARAVGETEAASLALHNLQCLAWLRGEYATSQQRAEEALALARAEGWDWLVPSILINYGLATADLSDLGRAAALLREGLALGHARGNLWDVGTALEGLARVRAGFGRARLAVKLFGAAATLRNETGIPQSNTDRAYYEPFLTTLQEALGADAFAAAWAEGRAMSWQDAMTNELASPAETDSMTTRAGRVQDATHGLTARELDVLRLLVAGESNRAIGERLFISPTTVASHVANIYSKLGVDSRATATAFALRHDLV